MQATLKTLTGKMGIEYRRFPTPEIMYSLCEDLKFFLILINAILK